MGARNFRQKEKQVQRQGGGRGLESAGEFVVSCSWEVSSERMGAVERDVAMLGSSDFSRREWGANDGSRSGA